MDFETFFRVISISFLSVVSRPQNIITAVIALQICQDIALSISSTNQTLRFWNIFLYLFNFPGRDTSRSRRSTGGRRSTWLTTRACTTSSWAPDEGDGSRCTRFTIGAGQSRVISKMVSPRRRAMQYCVWVCPLLQQDNDPAVLQRVNTTACCHYHW